MPMKSAADYSILFVCMGNICRSPTAEGVFRHMVEEAGLADQVFIDSAGTTDYHVGSPPDRRSQRHAQARGYDLSGLRARAVSDDDFARFDLLLAMDQNNLSTLYERCPPEYLPRCQLFLNFAPTAPVTAVPDPYYGGADGFGRVLDLVEQGCAGLLAHVQQRLRAGV